MMIYKAPRRRLGQHFLFDDKVIRRIVDYASLSPRDIVLEVGAGLGSLTFKLAEEAGRVIAVEKDQRLYRRLKQKLSRVDNVELVYGDVFKVALPYFNKVVSNLPYSISKEFTLWLLRSKFERAVLLLQREYADKLAAPPGSEHYSWISAVSQLFAQVSLREVIPKSLFEPPPKVDSRIVILNPRFEKGILKDELENFSLKLFSYKNKRLLNALRIIHGRDRGGFLKAYFNSLEEEGFPLNIRVRQLTPDMVERLFRIWDDLRRGWRVGST
jgi:16S rRNA (adenine1518-N6/adenine1519-N6)-dimethyltransferase